MYTNWLIDLTMPKYVADAACCVTSSPLLSTQDSGAERKSGSQNFWSPTGMTAAINHSGQNPGRLGAQRSDFSLIG